MTKFRRPRALETKPRDCKGRPYNEKQRAADRSPKSEEAMQRKLQAIRRGGVPKGKILNPHGRDGVNEKTVDPLYDVNAWKPEVLRRRRERLKADRARALEMHELQERARQAAGQVLDTLIEISGNKRAPEASRIAASVAVLDRGYGKASQTSITANVTNGKAADLTGDELDRRVKQTLKRVEDLTRRKGEEAPSEKRPPNIRELN